MRNPANFGGNSPLQTVDIKYWIETPKEINWEEVRIKRRINVEKFLKNKNNMENKETINHPSHYGGEDNTYEAIKIIEHYNLGFHLGNVIKYCLRAGKKDTTKTLEDLQKAKWYLQREIERQLLIGKEWK